MKAFFTCLCVICVAYGILSFLPEEKAIDKMTRFAITVCFLMSLISASSGLSKEDISFSFIEQEDIDYSVVSGQAFEEAIGQMLENKGLSYEKISVDSSENEDGSISINEITVYGAKDKKQCEAAIKENTGLDREVIVYE